MYKSKEGDVKGNKETQKKTATEKKEERDRGLRRRKDETPRGKMRGGLKRRSEVGRSETRRRCEGRR